MYLDCLRTGQRESYERPLYQRRSMMAPLAIGECLEGRGRFLDAQLDLAWAICEESSWAFPAHQLQLADPRRPHIDLMAASTAWTWRNWTRYSVPSWTRRSASASATR
jgi:hypothetical protein